MTSLLLSWLVMSIVVYLTAAIVPGVEVRSFFGAVWVAALFGVLNLAIGWLLFLLIGVGTLGLGFVFALVTRFFVDALVLKLTAALTSQLQIKSFGRALLAALVMALLTSLAELLLVQPHAPEQITL